MLVPIPSYEGFYSINEVGQVYGHNRENWKKQLIDKDGYLIVNLYKPNCKFKIGKIHRLMISSWLGSDFLKQGAVVDHIDNNRKNNLLSNLRVTSIEVNNNNNLKNKLHKNNTSGYSNVYFNKKAKAWKVEIPFKGKLLFYGYFKDKQQAISLAKELISLKHKRLGI